MEKLILFLLKEKKSKKEKKKKPNLSKEKKDLANCAAQATQILYNGKQRVSQVLIKPLLLTNFSIADELIPLALQYSKGMETLLFESSSTLALEDKKSQQPLKLTYT